MNQDIIFRGLMRSQTFFGIPMMPFMLVQGSFLLCFFFFSFHFIWVIAIAQLVMQRMVKHDEQIFDLIGVRLMTWNQCRGAQRVDRYSVVLTPLR